MAHPVSPSPAEPSSRVRAMAILVVVVCLFGTLMGRLWYLQGVEASTGTAAVVAEGIETIYIPAPRGDIYDRNGVLLAGNQIEQVVIVEPGAALADPKIVDELSALLGEPASAVKAAIDNPQYSPIQPVPIDDGVSTSVVLAIDENPTLFPGVKVQAQPVRYYPYGPTTANIVGYVSQITGSEYEAVKAEKCGAGLPCYQTTSQFGQAGIEESFEKYLRGTPGKEEVQVDSQGQPLDVVGYTPPVPGDDLVLSMSLTDQQAAVAALDDWVTKARRMVDTVTGYDFRAPGASMVVEDPRNGQILAMATYPDYDPSDFIGGISSAKWEYYNNPKNDFPLIDRAISTGYAPGSTWKLITATAMLSYGLRTADTYYDDVGEFTIGGQTFFDNDNEALGEVDLPEAITQSSDTYFYSIGGQFYEDYDAGRQVTGPDPLQRVASQYGFGHYSGIDLPDENPGLVPDAPVVAKMHSQYPKAYPDGNWEPGFEVQEAIGEGLDEVTPLQLAGAYAAFANDGTLYVPQLVLAVEAPGSGDKMSNRILVRYTPEVKNHVTMPPAYDRSAMLQGFEGVTAASDGTAYADFVGFPLNKYPVAGKTGTAQVDSYCAPPGPCTANQVSWPAYKQDTSVFSSFAPATDPRFVVDAVFEQSGYGADVAAPAVEQEYTTLFGLNKPAPKRSGTTTTTTGTGTTGTGTTGTGTTGTGTTGTGTTGTGAAG
jgi:penicillin-binding protein 2